MTLARRSALFGFACLLECCTNFQAAPVRCDLLRIFLVQPDGLTKKQGVAHGNVGDSKSFPTKIGALGKDGLGAEQSG